MPSLNLALFDVDTLVQWVSAIRDGDAAALDRTWGAIKNQRLNDRQHNNTHDAGD